MDGSPQRVSSSDESLRFLLNFFMMFTMVLNGLIIERRPKSAEPFGGSVLIFASNNNSSLGGLAAP
jgi:hypothetical protein